MINAALKGDLITRNPNGYMALATRAAELEREERRTSSTSTGPRPASTCA